MNRENISNIIKIFGIFLIINIFGQFDVLNQMQIEYSAFSLPVTIHYGDCKFVVQTFPNKISMFMQNKDRSRFVTVEAIQRGFEPSTFGYTDFVNIAWDTINNIWDNFKEIQQSDSPLTTKQ